MAFKNANRDIQFFTEKISMFSAQRALPGELHPRIQIFCLFISYYKFCKISREILNFLFFYFYQL